MIAPLRSAMRAERFPVKRLPVKFLCIAIAVLSVSTGCDSKPPAPPADASVGTVTVQIVGAESTQTVEIPEVADGTTLESVMRSIDQPLVNMSGSGTTAFVDSIGEQKTDATRGWTFKVDGEFANQGIGQTVLHPPTTVTWTFGEFEM